MLLQSDEYSDNENLLYLLVYSFVNSREWPLEYPLSPGIKVPSGLYIAKNTMFSSDSYVRRFKIVSFVSTIMRNNRLSGQAFYVSSNNALTDGSNWLSYYEMECADAMDIIICQVCVLALYQNYLLQWKIHAHIMYTDAGNYPSPSLRLGWAKLCH